MENLRLFFINFNTQFKNFWASLNTSKKVVFISIISLVLISIFAFLIFQTKKTYEYLFVNLSDEDQHAIVAFLKKNGLTDYIVDQKGIKVPSEHVLMYRVKLSQEGLPTHGLVGWEKFDSSDFTRTEFERNINRLRAIQGELARTIMSIEGIINARVHIVMPPEKIFQQDQKDPTAAIYIKTKRGVTLTNKQITGIVHLVSRSVEGLKPENITIIDFEGKLLTEEKVADPTIKQTKELLEYKKNLEKQFEEKIRTIVGRVVGMDRVEAKVDVEVDYTKEEQTISDIDPEKTVVISSNISNQEISGSGLNPTGIPGSKSNVPSDQEELKLTTSQSKSTRGTELVNYEVAKTISHKVLPVGKIVKISAAVIVDGKQTYNVDGKPTKFEPRSEEEMKKLEELVKSAIGYVQGRDEVKIHNLMFQPDFVQIQEIQEKKKENREYLSTLILSATIALALVLFFAFIVRPYFRWLSYDPERKHEETIIEEFKPELELNMAQNIKVKEDVPFDKLTPQEQVIYIAKHDPKRTTEAIRVLLNPHSNA